MEELIKAIRSYYPEIRIKKGKKFAFHSPNTIIIGPYEPQAELLLLHELGHALLGKNTFKTDVERLKIESEAWDKAQLLSKEFNIKFDSTFAQNQLDSYRDWLHQKSLCKTCNLTRYQTPDGRYHCPRCGS